MDDDPEGIKYKFTMDLLRDQILDLTCDQIADKLSDRFIEQYGDIVMEKAYISDDELRKRVVEKLSERIIDEYCEKRKGTNNE